MNATSSAGTNTETAPGGALIPLDPSVPSVALYCETHAACYRWLATAETWTALDATRAALCVYLVRAEVRPACRVSWPAPGGWEAGAKQHLGPLGLEARESEDGPLVVAAALSRDGAQDAPEAAKPPGQRQWVGTLRLREHPDRAEPGPAKGALTWVAAGGAGDISLWSEPLGPDADLERISEHLRAIQRALRPLGYTAQVSVK